MQSWLDIRSNWEVYKKMFLHTTAIPEVLIGLSVLWLGFGKMHSSHSLVSSVVGLRHTHLSLPEMYLSNVNVCLQLAYLMYSHLFLGSAWMPFSGEKVWLFQSFSLVSFLSFFFTHMYSSLLPLVCLVLINLATMRALLFGVVIENSYFPPPSLCVFICKVSQDNTQNFHY